MEEYTNGQQKVGPTEMSSDEALRKMRTAGSISLTPELFEKLYLQPQNKVKGDLRKTFANPTPIAIIGFLMCLGPLSCDLMGWRGAGGSGAANSAVYFFFGGVLMIIGGVLEFFIGNTYPCCVFLNYGAFWMSYGGTLLPQFNAYAPYAPADATSAAEGLLTQGFNASFGFFILSIGLVTFFFLICSIRTNIVFVVIFFSLTMCVGFITGAYWQLAQGNAVLAGKLLVGGGACSFVTTAGGWWLLLVQLLAAVDFPINLPVGDLSTVIKGASDRKKLDV